MTPLLNKYIFKFSYLLFASLSENVMIKNKNSNDVRLSEAEPKVADKESEGDLQMTTKQEPREPLQCLVVPPSALPPTV